MSRNRKISRTMVIAATGVVLLITLAIIAVFNPLEDQIRRYPNGDLSDFNDTSYYKINPETIMRSLDRGETGVFLPELATPQAPKVEAPFTWHQSDYLRIATALYQFVWKETANGWNVYFIQFETSCQDYSMGFGLADFYYFKTIFMNGQIEYAAREIRITPESGEVSVGEDANFPHPLVGWRSINLGTLKLSADDALQVAEQNGGKEFRSNARNDCRIHVNLNPNVDRADWLVFYSVSDGSIFEVYIDPYSGGVVK
jgi:hypothetical protein